MLHHMKEDKQQGAEGIPGFKWRGIEFADKLNF